MAADIAAIVPPLLRALTVLEFIARHLDPLTFDEMFAAVGTPEAPLRTALDAWDGEAEAEPAIGAGRLALTAFDGIRDALANGDDLFAVYAALRHLPRALEALYARAADTPAVNAFFLDSSLRGDPEALARAARPSRDGETGVMQIDDGQDGFWLYVPESYTPERPLPLVMALHGGAGRGRSFLWSWLRDARSFGAIVVAPTASGRASGRSWALTGEDVDTPNLHRILDRVSARWRIDPARLLMTGMSDGGTFCYVSGLEAASRFTHLAPVAATWHPLLAAMADAERIRGLPIHIVHGARDWMFPVEVARRAAEALAAAGANVRYREIDDLSHCYPREINPALLQWLRETPGETLR